MTPRLLAALDALETANAEVVEARKAEIIGIVTPPAPANKVAAVTKHVFSPVNVAAVKSPAAVPPVLPAKTPSAPVKRPAAATASPLSVQKPASVPQMVTCSHPHRRKTAGM
jgi:hypothetical protein